MWIAEFRMWHESPMLEATRKYDAKIYSYYLNVFEDKGKRFINKAIVVEGKDAGKAIEEIAADPRVTVFFKKGNQIFYSLPVVDSFHASVLDRRIFSLKPQIGQNGTELWTLASSDKKALLGLVKKVNSPDGKTGIELLSIRREDPNFFAQGALNSLTDLQRTALLAAYREGYYEYPRNVDLKKLAKKLGVPRTTLTEHLRKAEAKIMPLVLYASA